MEHEIWLIAQIFLIHKPWGAGVWNLISEGYFDYIEPIVLPVGLRK